MTVYQETIVPPPTFPTGNLPSFTIGDSVVAVQRSSLTLSSSFRLGMPAGDAAGWHVRHILPASCLDAFAVQSSVTRRYRGVAACIDTVLMHQQLGAVGTYHLRLQSAIGISDIVVRQLRAILQSRFALSDRISLKLAVKLAERVRLSTALSAKALMSVMVRDAFSAKSFVTYAHAMLLADKMSFDDATSFLFQAIAQIADVVTFEDRATPLLRILVTESDAVALSEDMVLEAIYTGLLQDGIDFVAEYVDPSGGITAWAMNARSGGVTEYSNWAFNSYAKLADRYVAAGDDGLYELIGDRDQTTPIIADLANGLMELAGSHMTGFKAAYIATCGPGQWFLKIEGDDKSTTYSVVSRSLRTRRVDLGKGWRSRYMHWELTSTGQDFDLTGLTFLPITSMRRVQ